MAVAAAAGESSSLPPLFAAFCCSSLLLVARYLSCPVQQQQQQQHSCPGGALRSALLACPHCAHNVWSAEAGTAAEADTVAATRCAAPACVFCQQHQLGAALVHACCCSLALWPCSRPCSRQPRAWHSPAVHAHAHTHHTGCPQGS